MRRLRLAAGRWTSLAVRAAAALAYRPELVRADAHATGSGTNALPGVDTVPLLAQPGAPLTANATLGYGYTEAVLDAGDAHHRALTRLALGYAALPWLALAARLDGRFDAHSGAGGGDSGFVAHSQLLARGMLAVSSRAHVGAEAAVRFPGASDPVRGLSATSGDLRALLGITIPDAALSLGSAFGFRLDRARHGVEDPARLSLHDRVGLGAAGSNAVLLGVAVERRFASFALLGEWSWDLHVGDAAPDALASPMRLSAGARLFANDALQVQLLAGVSPSDRPELTASGPLQVVEPRFWITSTVSFYFNATPTAMPSPTAPPPVAPPPAAPAPVYGMIAGRALDAAGSAPLSGVSIAVDGRDAVLTDAEGRFAIDQLPEGVLELRVSAPGFRAVGARASVIAGETAELDVALERELPEGQLHGTVRGFDGAPLVARIHVKPIGAVVESAQDGSFELDVAPGMYRVVISAPGYRSQERPVVVEHNGVTVIVVELSAAR
jgi:hypothetical protein